MARQCGLRVGVPKEFFGEGVSAGVLEATRAALKQLEQLGATLVDVSLPRTELSIPVYYIIAPAEASSNLSRFDGVKFGHRAAKYTDLNDMYRQTRAEGFGPEVKRRIMLGTYVLSAGYYDAYYLKAQQVRTLIRRDFEQALQGVDAVAVPTSPVPAFKIGERADNPLQMYLADVFTVSPNLAGLPAISVPCGFTPETLPVGLQLTGRAWDEATLFRLAHAYERATTWHQQRPPV